MTENWRMAGYVFIGGALGTMLRYFLSEAISVTAEFPTGELIALTTINLLGAHFLGLTARLPYFQTLWCKWLWAYGFAGGFTTMSAVDAIYGYKRADMGDFRDDVWWNC